jgi:3-oxoacyl-[acyl-carrier-protein] synthase III
MSNGNPFLHIEKDVHLEIEYISCIVPAVLELLQKEGLELEDINKFFPPQISSTFISELGNALKVPLEKFVNVVGEEADLFSSSTLFAMENAITNEIVGNGDIGLIINVGSGIQVGCAIYHF